MKLILQNGYPFPYPSGITESQKEAIADAAAGNRLEIDGVKGFEWKHTVTVEFHSFQSMMTAQTITGWSRRGDGFVLHALTSAEDGYGHPAIIANTPLGNATSTAYCGFILHQSHSDDVDLIDVVSLAAAAATGASSVKDACHSGAFDIATMSAISDCATIASGLAGGILALLRGSIPCVWSYEIMNPLGEFMGREIANNDFIMDNCLLELGALIHKAFAHFPEDLAVIAPLVKQLTGYEVQK